MKMAALVCFLACLFLVASQATQFAKLVIADSVERIFSDSAIVPSTVKPVRARLPCEEYACTDDYTPLCGLSLCSGVRTFSNACAMDNHNRCQYPRYEAIFKGSCDTFFKCQGRHFPDIPLLYPKEESIESNSSKNTATIHKETSTEI